MNDRQNTVVATVIAGLVLAVVFFCPWRVEPSDDIRWSPIYQTPMSYVRVCDPGYGTEGGSRVESEDAHVAVDILALEVFAIIAAGGLLYVLLEDSEEDDEAAGPTDR